MTNGGGSGMYLERYFPDPVFCSGHYSGDGTICLPDRFILNTSAQSYPLPAAIMEIQ